MSDWTALASGDDLSVNFVRPAGNGGLWEARCVRRRAEYAVVYLSSQSGCRQACRMCHLTATGQTMERGATLEDDLAQADVVLAHLDRMEAVHGHPGLINVNLMARGEPLANPHFLSGWRALSEALEERAGRRGMGNPPPSTGAYEPSEEVLDARFRALAEGLAGPSSRQVPRVGFDVRASCGMFVEGPAARRRAA